MTDAPLSKMTKAELAEAYRKLLERYDQLKATAQTVGEPPSVALLERVKDYTVERLTKSTADLKASFGSTLDQFAARLAAEAQKLGEVQQAQGPVAAAA